MQPPAYITGSIAPVFTVFNEDGSLDDAGQRNLLDFMLERGGVSAYFIRSGMGQMYTFDMDDTRQIARNACAHMAGKAPVLIGCSGIWDHNRDRLPDKATYIEQAIELGRYAAGLGADGVVYTVPEGLLPEDGESIPDLIARYVETVCAAVDCGVYLYQAPRIDPAYIMPPALVARLADIDNLLGMKASTNDAYYISEAARAVRGKDFAYIAGAETSFYAALPAGARACIGQGASLNPRLLNLIQERFQAGDMQGMLDVQHDVNCLCEQCPNAVDFFKRYATEHGYPAGPTARSLANNPYMEDKVPLDDAGYAAFKAVFEETCARY